MSLTKPPDLHQLTSQRILHVLGVNSGTSADGLDFSLVRLVFRRGDKLPVASYLAGASRPFPPALRRRILALADHAEPLLAEVLALNEELGAHIGVETRRVVALLRRRGFAIDAICSHGQTVRHLPNEIRVGGRVGSATCQLGSPERIAAATGLCVVADVRQGDIATGGEGAPITVAAMKLLCGDQQESRLIVNIGGISNYFWFPAGSSWTGIQAADCGPGNLLIDQLSSRFFNRPYDRNGELARRGKLSEPFSRWSLKQVGSRNQSTGREAFGADWLNRFITKGKSLGLDRYDLIANATELTAQVIARQVVRLRGVAKGNVRLSLTGGGAANSFLVRRLDALCTQSTGSRMSGGGVVVESIAKLGIPPQQVESAAYAVMAGAVLAGYPIPTRWRTDGSVAALGIPGRIVQPSRIVKRFE